MLHRYGPFSLSGPVVRSSGLVIDMRLLSRQVLYTSTVVYGSSKSCCLTRLMIRTSEILASTSLVLSSVSYAVSSTCSNSPDLDIETVIESFFTAQVFTLRLVVDMSMLETPKGLFGVF